MFCVCLERPLVVTKRAHLGVTLLFPIQVADFHCPHRTCEDDGITVAAGMAEAKEIQARVGESFTPGYEGFWESQEVGSGTSLCNPYASALLIVAEEGGAGKKVRVGPCCPSRASQKAS